MFFDLGEFSSLGFQLWLDYLYYLQYINVKLWNGLADDDMMFLIELYTELHMW